MSARDDNRQRGMVLIFALVFLLIITIAAIVSFKMSKTSLDIVGNTQSRDAAIASANSAIQEALSTTRMFEAPDAVFLLPCSGANTKCYDINGDGTDEIEVALTPSPRSEEHTSELQSLMRKSYAVFCLKKKMK